MITLKKQMGRVFVTHEVMRDWTPWRNHPIARLRLEAGMLKHLILRRLR